MKAALRAAKFSVVKLRANRSAKAVAFSGLLIGCVPGSDSVPGDAGVAAPPFAVNCQAPAPSTEALRPPGQHAVTGEVSTGWVQPGGRDLLPVGTLLPTGGYPMSLRVLPAPYDHYVITSNSGHGPNYVMIVDTQATDPKQAVVAQLKYQDDGSGNSPALFYGLQVGTQGGVHAFVAGGGFSLPDPTNPMQNDSVIDMLSISGSPPQLAEAHRFLLPPGPFGPSFPAGLYLSADEKLLYYAGQHDGSLGILNVDGASADYGRVVGSLGGMGLYPYDVAVDESLKRAYVSMWGGGITAPGGDRDGLVAVDVSNPAAPALVSDPALIPALSTGKASEQLLLTGSTLFVAAADGDVVTALDTTAMAMPVMQSLTGPNQGLLGASPNALAVDPAAMRLYVANSHDNTVSVLALPSLMPLGRIPTAAFPTSVGVLSDGTVVVGCAKGIGSYPTDRLPGDGTLYEGIVQVVPKPSAQDLLMWDQLATQANTRPQSYQIAPTCSGTPRHFPLPVQPGDDTPIKYVFLIVKENQTYDQILGDLPGANGSPALALFGGDNTPNQHELAKRFTNLDNFYANADQSTQGHEWTSSSYSNDFVEKASTQRNGHPDTDFGGSPANEHASVGGAGSVFQALSRAKIPYQNYGEIVNALGAGEKYDSNYPGLFFNLDVADVDRANYLVSKLNDPTVELERFHYILMPRDHTYGTSPGEPTPQSMFADNDEAVGRFIDGLSHSIYWPQSIVFIIEDDPQDGADHVDQHRSLCLVVSPWVKHGYVSSVNYDDPSLWHTLELLLGLPPLNSLDAGGAGMYDVFASTPDLTPYTYIPRKIPEGMNLMSAPMAAESAAIDFSQPDSAHLGRILWRAVRGTEPPFGELPDDDD